MSFRNRLNERMIIRNMVGSIRSWRSRIECELRMRWKKKKVENGVKVRDEENIQNKLG